MAAAFLTAAAAFIGTNIDDILVLTLLFAQTGTSSETRRVIIGQYCGIAFLTSVSMLGAWGTQLIPSRYIGLLGLVPLLLGVRVWINARRGEAGQEHGGELLQIGIGSTALLTIANGADNIGVYIPVFSGESPGELALTAAVFAAMTGLWCFLGRALASEAHIRARLVRYQRILVPAVLIALGISILIKNYGFLR